MPTPDLNLLVALDVLLTEGSVAKAARRLRLSPSAMSRTLTRLRETTGDPLLVRAGRGLVPTPRALALRDPVQRAVEDGVALLRPVETIDPSLISRTFIMRVSDGFAESFAPILLAILAVQAPGVRVHFLQKTDKDSAPLREGRVDLETGVIEETTGPELRSQSLFQDRLLGLVRPAHPLSLGRVSRQTYLGARHVLVSRNGHPEAAVDVPYLPADLKRDIGTIVGGFAAALSLARASDLVATVPDRHTRGLQLGLVKFDLPFQSEPFTVSMLWHPRMDADPAHRWLRSCVRQAVATVE
ncbi:MAG: LysR family transcriptional regulator [Sphingomonadales bacterium]|nr:LysR family transcriptional regulator [Sphingomonadales bacterium]